MAEKQGIYTEDNVNNLVKDIRKEIWEKRENALRYVAGNLLL